MTRGVGSTDPPGSAGGGFAGAGAKTWEPVIGLEIHVHLKTRTKMFCACEVAYFDPPNSHTCPVCLAHPGALPVANAKAVEYTIKLGLALGCEIAPRALFHRKNYFYPDLPKGYQISQYDVPLCGKGAFTVPEPGGDRVVGITRAHLEEDAAKNVHVGGSGGRIGGAAHTNVDFNRGGTPLVEIVTEPDLRSADEAKRFLQLLRQTIVELGISDAEMEKGTLRVDANVSVREQGATGYRTRTELKNMNSFSFIARGIEAEIERQIGVWESGGEVVQQTFDFHAGTGKLTPRRVKEEADDYRYFPEPDLVPVEPPAELVERLRTEVPEPPGVRLRRLEGDVGFELAEGLVASGRDRLHARLSARGLDPVTAANVTMNEIASAGVNPDDVDDELVEVIEKRQSISRETLLAAIAASVEPDFSATPFLEQTLVSASSELEPLIDDVLAANAGQVAAYRSGKEGLLGFFVGQVMKRTEGKADPRAVNELLREKLNV